MLHVLALMTALSPAMAWRQIGPAAAGGRVAAVAGTDDDSLLYYFGAAGGGVFKSTNGGLTWRDVWPSYATSAIGAIAIAPHHANVVWVGTGEAAPRNDASYGDGVWRSTDGGRRWSHCGLVDSYAIAGIVVDPHDPQVALAGVLGNPFRDSAERGVYRTTDGGRTWRRTLYAGPQSGISDVTADKSGKIVYAGVWQFRRKPWTFSSGGVRDGLYKSTDGGVTWRRLAGGGLPHAPLGRIGIALASNPQRVYALIQSRAGLLWRSDDGGAHWRMMSRDTLIDQRPFYMSRLAVDPRDENHVFFASENLIETHDGGKTFDDVVSAVHQDHHGFWISHNGRRIIEADDGGAPISVDGGKTWDWRFNVVLAQTYHVGYDDRVPYDVCGGFQDNDSFCGPSNGLSPLGIVRSDWRDVANNSDGVWALPQPGDAGLIWNEGVNELNGQLGIYEMRSRQNYDITPSVTDTNGRDLAGIPYRFNWDAPLAFAPLEPGTVYYGANVLFETRDAGRTWTAISPDLTRNDASKQRVAGGPINTDVSGAEFYDTLLTIAPSTLDAKTIWAGTDDGLIQKTSDGGVHWENVTPSIFRRPGMEWGRVECIEASAFSADRAYAVVNRNLLGDRTPYVLVTDDGGAHWRRIDAGLPQGRYAHVIREDPGDPNVLYAGLEQGAWFSTDRGAHWRSLQLNMPAVAIYDLLVQPRERDLIAGTHGRGLWILDDLVALEHRPLLARAKTPVLLPIRPAYTWYQWWTSSYGTYDTGCCVAAGEYSGDDPPAGATITYDLPKAVAGPVRIRIADSEGDVVRTLPASSAAGLHRTAWDLGAAAPVPWLRARAWNRGPSSGPTVVPGSYVVTLLFPGGEARQSVSVRPDPRATWTAADYAARYGFLSELYGELSSIDAALNRLDAIRPFVTKRQREAFHQVYSELTSGVINSEDDMWYPDRLRERLTILLGDVALSQGPPLAPHLREAAAIRLDFERAMASYDAFLAANGYEKETGP